MASEFDELQNEIVYSKLGECLRVSALTDTHGRRIPVIIALGVPIPFRDFNMMITRLAGGHAPSNLKSDDEKFEQFWSSVGYEPKMDDYMKPVGHVSNAVLKAFGIQSGSIWDGYNEDLLPKMQEVLRMLKEVV